MRSPRPRAGGPGHAPGATTRSSHAQRVEPLTAASWARRATRDALTNADNGVRVSASTRRPKGTMGNRLGQEASAAPGAGPRAASGFWPRSRLGWWSVGLTVAALAYWRSWWRFDVLIDTFGNWVGVAGAVALARARGRRSRGRRVARAGEGAAPLHLSGVHCRDDPVLAAVPRRRAAVPALTATARVWQSRTGWLGSRNLPNEAYRDPEIRVAPLATDLLARSGRCAPLHSSLECHQHEVGDHL